VSLILSNAGEKAVYFLGNPQPGGHPLYFLTALAVKLPPGFLALIMLGIAGLWLRRNPQDLFWAAPPFVYLALASASGLQLGVRLVLPAIAFLAFFAGAGAQLLWTGRRRIAVFVAVGAVAVSSLRYYPYGISYFNEAAGGPKNGLKYLADSNLDWGQDLRRLAELVERERIPRIRLAYFGNDNPYRFFTDERLERIAPPWGDEWAQGTVFQPQPGWYALSATLLPGHFFAPKYHDYYRVFRARAPDAYAGYSIYVYHVR
jgi:hypothetical protein